MLAIQLQIPPSKGWFCPPTPPEGVLILIHLVN